MQDEIEFITFKTSLLGNGIMPEEIKDDLIEYYEHRINYYELIKDTLSKSEQLQMQARLSYLHALINLIKCACSV